jgi:thermitase
VEPRSGRGRHRRRRRHRVLTTHPDFAGQLATTADIPANGVDDDANGFIDDSNGWDFVREDNDPNLEDGDNAHGTHVAGIIAAAKNDIFTVGTAPQAKVLPLRVLNGPNATGNWSDITDAFVYAGKMGIPIVNASLGGGGVVESVRDAVALYPNTLYVVAAGNNGKWLNPDFVYYPCDAPSQNVMCVGATDATDTRASFSNFSKVSVDVFAPGQGIVSLLADQQRHGVVETETMLEVKVHKFLYAHPNLGG